MTSPEPGHSRWPWLVSDLGVPFGSTNISLCPDLVPMVQHLLDPLMVLWLPRSCSGKITALWSQGAWV